MTNNPENVLMAVCNFFDPDNRVFRAANAIQEIGYSVTLLAYYKQGLAEKQILGTGFNILRIKSKEIIKISHQVNNWQKRMFFKIKAKKFADNFKPGIVHCHDYDTLFLGIYCKKKFNSKVIYDCHEYFQDLNYLHRYPLFIRKHIARFERHVIKNHVDEMIVVSPGIAELYQIFSKNRVHLIRNIPDFSEVDTTVKLPDNLMSFLIGQRNTMRKLFLYLGTNSQKGRGMDFAFKLLKVLPDEFGMISCGASSIEEVNLLKEKSIYEGVENRYQPFLSLSGDQLFQIAKYCYMGLSLIEPVYISYKHSLPNKLFEYLAMGLPVISSDIPDQSEIILKYNAGIVIPFNLEISKGIILQTKEKAFNPEIQKIFSWEKEKKEYGTLYSNTK
jgi:alpha-maltose-1-phosphate synthase